MRVPPTPSLDSLLTPLYRRRSAMGLEAAERRVLARRSALLQWVGVVLCVLLLLALPFFGGVLAPPLAAYALALAYHALPGSYQYT